MIEHTTDKARKATQSPRETGEAALNDAGNAVAQATDGPRDTLADKAASVRQSVSDTAAGLRQSVGQTAEAARQSVAQGGDRVAESLRGVAEGQAEGTMQRRVLDTVAGSVEGVSDTIRSASLNQVMHDTEAFARRNPLLFLAGAALAGFAIARLAAPRGGARHYDRYEPRS